ncbi:type II toxin-antitoxin system prevent-host-death family antitoxin [Methylomagnum sp.]
MESFEVYTARDLRNRSGELLKHTAEGSISVITKHGKPSVLAIPFDAHLLQHGIHRVLGLHMVRTRQLTLAQAAKLAGMDLSSFIDLLGASGIDAVDYPPEELSEELENALAAGCHR